VRTHLRLLKAPFGAKDTKAIDAGDTRRLIARSIREGKKPKTPSNDEERSLGLLIRISTMKYIFQMI
jgi:hypothetical protein